MNSCQTPPIIARPIWMRAANKARKKEATKIINELLEKMGIADVEPIPIEEVRKSMANRIRAEDNEFSRAIIAEREK